MTTWKNISDEISTLLRDPGKESYSESLRMACWSRACDFFAITHTALFKSVTATASSESVGWLVDYPIDFIEMPSGGVQLEKESNRRWLEPATINPGTEGDINGYLQMSNGIFFTGEYDSVSLWYYANYTKPTGDSTLLDVPKWAEWALINLTMGYMMYPLMMSQAMLRQFQQKREAGSPEDNPPRTQAVFCMRLYSELVGRVKPQDRSVFFKPN